MNNINNFIEIKDILKNDIFFAHLTEDKKETLFEHTKLTEKYFEKLSKDVLLKFDFFSNDFFKTIFYAIPTFHDIGKINPVFQYLKMRNNNFKTNKNYSNHSMLSALIYIDFFYHKIMNLDLCESEKIKLLYFTYINGYIIKCHHGNLISFNSFLKNINSNKDRIQINSMIDNITCFLVNDIDFNFSIMDISEHIDINDNEYKELYIYTKLAFSLLTASDYYATSEFMSNTKINNFGDIDFQNEIINIYNNTEISLSISNYRKNRKTKFNDEKNINILRSELFIEAEEKLLKNLDKNIYYLEAPTGSGKSNTAFNLSFKLIENCNIKKIIYVYPFNTLVEQNLDSLNKIFNNSFIKEKIAVVNSITPIKTNTVSEENCTIDYDKSYLDKEFLNYPIVLTTHVSLFNWLFSNKKEMNFPLHNLRDSVIVLDEIQSYKNSIWTEIIEMLHDYCKLLNIKIIIMSATLPKLDLLLEYNIDTCSLVTNRNKYFNHEIFKSRVDFNFSLLDENNFNYSCLIEHIFNNHNKKIVVEFIKKKSANEFYDLIKENGNVYLLTGDYSIAARKQILDTIKSFNENENLILVSTQVIEAGVDIDMDIGYKDISILDNEEQLAGRINRECKKDNSILYFFNLDNAKDIYRNEFRIQNNVTITEKGIRDILINKNFSEYYKMIFDKIKKANIKRTSSYSTFKNYIEDLDFQSISEHMQLIEKIKKITVFLNTDITINNQVIHGSDIWNRYKELLKAQIPFAEKMIKLSEVNSYMTYFTYEINFYESISYNDIIGEIRYIDDGNKYLEDGRFKINKEVEFI